VEEQKILELHKRQEECWTTDNSIVELLYQFYQQILLQKSYWKTAPPQKKIGNVGMGYDCIDLLLEYPGEAKKFQNPQLDAGNVTLELM
jgi:hypothetical protein